MSDSLLNFMRSIDSLHVYFRNPGQSPMTTPPVFVELFPGDNSPPLKIKYSFKTETEECLMEIYKQSLKLCEIISSEKRSSELRIYNLINSLYTLLITIYNCDGIEARYTLHLTKYNCNSIKLYVQQAMRSTHYILI